MACRFGHDPPDAILLEGIHELCVTLIRPETSKKNPWKPDGQRVSLENLGGMWLDGEALRLAVKNQLRWFSAIHPRGFAWNPVFRDAYAKRLWSRATQAFAAKTCRAAHLPAPHMIPKTVEPPRQKPATNLNSS